MTNSEKYESIILTLGEVISNKDREITLLNYQVEELNRRLTEAEYHLDPCGKERPKSLEIR